MTKFPLPLAKQPKINDGKRVSDIILENQKVRVVKIQLLPEVEEVPSETKNKQEAIDVPATWKNKKSDGRNGTVITYFENSEARKSAFFGNGFFAAFIEAYNKHEDVILSPDDVWLTVCLYFSKFVNDHAEELRDRFLSHEGKKNLTVTTWNEISETEWTEFLGMMKAEIAANTKGDIVNVLQSDFSSTSLVDGMISTACIMSSFKKYFSFGRCIPACGIRNVCFMGTREDWQDILKRLNKVESCVRHPEFSLYIKDVQKIITQFVATYDGNVDVDWWNKIFYKEYESIGSGGDVVEWFNGWILDFFGMQGRCDLKDFVGRAASNIDVPVNIHNQITGEIKQVHLVGGFSDYLHVAEFDGRKAHRPHTSMIVFHDPDNNENQIKAEKHFGRSQTRKRKTDDY